jgi:hypothetical protein
MDRADTIPRVMRRAYGVHVNMEMTIHLDL